MSYILQILKEMNVNSVKIASAFHKPGKFVKEVKIDYLGMVIEDHFIVGYGLDWDEFGRNLDKVYRLV